MESQLARTQAGRITEDKARYPSPDAIYTLAMDTRLDSEEVFSTKVGILEAIPWLERLQLVESDFLERLATTGERLFFPFHLVDLRLDSVTQPWVLATLLTGHSPETLKRLVIRAPREEWYPPPDLSHFSALHSLELETRPSPNDPPSTLTRISVPLGDHYRAVWTKRLASGSPSTEPDAFAHDRSIPSTLLDYIPQRIHSLTLSTSPQTAVDCLEWLHLDVDRPPRLRVSVTLLDVSEEEASRIKNKLEILRPSPITTRADLRAGFIGDFATNTVRRGAE